jgi:hypothetical protein
MNPSPKLAQQLNADEQMLWYGRPLKTPFQMGVLEFISIGIAAILVLAYLAWTYGRADPQWYVFAVSIGSVCIFMFLLYAPYRLLKGARDTEYMITNQRVFFETMSEYAFQGFASKMGGPEIVKVVNLEDIEGVYVRRGFHDRVFGTSTLYIRFRGFQRTTTHPAAEGTVILYHKPPSFAFIKKAYTVGEIIQEAVGKVQQNSQTMIPTSTSASVRSQNGSPTAAYVNKRSWVRQHVWLTLGAFLMLSGSLIFVYDYFFPIASYVNYENGYTYINYAGIFAMVLWMLGGVLLFLEFRKLAPKQQ